MFYNEASTPPSCTLDIDPIVMFAFFFTEATLCPGLGTQTCLGRVDSPMLGVLLDCSITCKSTHRMVLVGPCPGCTQLRCIQIGRFGRVDSPQFKVHSPQSIFDRPYSVPRAQTGWTCCGKLGSKSLYRSAYAVGQRECCWQGMCSLKQSKRWGTLPSLTRSCHSQRQSWASASTRSRMGRTCDCPSMAQATTLPCTKQR